MRRVIISMDDQPRKLSENTVWIKVDKPIDVANYIKIGIRMAPDELVIKKNCIGYFTIGN